MSCRARRGGGRPAMSAPDFDPAGGQQCPPSSLRGVILSLCDYSGAWSAPYEAAGYDVLRLDLARGHDLRLLHRLPCRVHGILAAVPCTEFARSGARWWRQKGREALLRGLSVVDASMRIVMVHRPSWWALENPIGRLQDYLGPPKFRFDPCDFGDPWTKRTWLWGQFSNPVKNRVTPIFGDVTTNAPAGDRSRANTPPGFARAFFEANP